MKLHHLLYFLLFLATPLSATPKPSHISESVWQQVSPYLIPDNHPIKSKLDKFFSKAGIIHDQKSLKKHGFKNPIPQPHTRVIVTKHSKFKGYIFKIYPDVQTIYHDHFEYVVWVSRVQGSQLIARYIDAHGLSALYKVPKKWIYTLPTTSPASKHPNRKSFILVAEEMDILSSAKNDKMWGGKKVNHAFLKSFFFLVTDLGLIDCAKPKNAPFCKDGKVAFIDTQTFNKLPFPMFRYEKLTPFLSPKMQVYWNTLIQPKN